MVTILVITYQKLITHQKGVYAFTALPKIKDFSVKKKMIMVSEWMKHYFDLYNEKREIIREEFDLEGFDRLFKDGNFAGTDEEWKDYLSATEDSRPMFKDLSKTEIERCPVTLKESDVQKLDLTGDQLADLVLLGILDMDDEKEQEED